MSKPVYKSTQNRTLGQLLKHEGPLGTSRKSVTVLAGSGASRVLTVGMLVGAVLVGGITITPAGGNTGTGALGAATLGAKAQAGDYKITCISAVANGGVFSVIDPSGNAMPPALVGVPYTSNDLNFTITDAATDWAVGDSITVTVADGSHKVVELSPEADPMDGTHRVLGLVAQDVTAPDGADASGLLIVEDAIVAAGSIVWPTGITEAQQTVALAELAERKIRVRTSG